MPDTLFASAQNVAAVMAVKMKDSVIELVVVVVVVVVFVVVVAVVVEQR